MRNRVNALLTAVVMMLTLPAVTAPTSATAADVAFERAEAEIVSENPFKGLSPGVFIVTLDDAPVATYDGGVGNLRGTSPGATGKRKVDARSPAAAAYRSHLELQHDKLLDRMGRVLGRTVEPKFEYFNATNGVAVFLTPAEAARVLRMPGVAGVAPEVVEQLATDNGPSWIGAPSIWDGSATGVGTQGEGIIVGVFDTGINPANPSFAAVGPLDGFVHTNPYGAGNFVGVCNPAEPDYQPGFQCNAKLIGAWNFTSGDGPTDDEGHGSHTAGTAAGNRVLATIAGPTFSDQRVISGVAPHANVIAYDVCLAVGGCPSSGTIAAIDQAILDGVDVINFSVGSPAPEDPWASPSQQAWLNARAAGIFVAHSAGNEGPDPATVGSPMAPWMTHVAALTHDRQYVNGLSDMSGGDTAPPDDMFGLGFTSGYGPAPIVYAGDFPSAKTSSPGLCGAGVLGDFDSPWPPGTFNGEIVVCDRGTFGRVEKGANVLAAGAGGYVLADNGDGLSGDAHELPGVHISQADGVALKAWLSTGSGHTAVIDGATLDVDPDNGDVMAGFSSRGPNRSADFIAPSVGAPGVSIVAPLGTDNAVEWGFRSGTSMSSPHVAGAAALLKALHPGWTPAQIESAMMTTAKTSAVKEDGVTPADWFDFGAGRVQLAEAARAGLVLDESIADYAAADPLLGGDPTQLNLASLSNAECVVTCTWTRTVTATVAETWKASATADGGVTLTAEPATFSLGPGDSQVLTITADVSEATPDVYNFGIVELEPEGTGTGRPAPLAHLPVAVKSTTGDLPPAVHIWTRRNAGSQAVEDLTALAITDLTVTVNGLVRGDMDSFTVAQDSNNASPYDDLGDGVVVVERSVPAGAAHLIAEILTAEAPDLDLFVGRDRDGDGPEESEEVCASTTPDSIESCTIDDPAAGDWWVLVQNWAASESPPDDFTLSTAVVTGDEDNMVVEGPDSVPALEPFGVRVFWDLPRAEFPDRFYGSFAIGTDPANPGNVGRIPVVLDRHEDDVTKAVSAQAADPGDVLTYEIAIQPNVTPEDLVYTIRDTIPDGLTYVEGSATNGATVSDGVVSWSGVVPSPALAQQSYVMSTSATDPMCDTGFGGYVDLEAFGILADPGVVGDTVAYQSFTAGDPIEFFGESYVGMGFTDDGFALFDPETNYAGQPWVPQTIPNPAPPNNVAAIMWHDFEIVYDAATNSGVTLAVSDAPGGQVLVEYDDVRLFGGTSAIADFEIIVSRAVDTTPGNYEVVYAYDNVQAVPNPVTIGVESLDGLEAVARVNNGDPSGIVGDGFMVCFDWQGPTFDPVIIQYQVTVDDKAAGLLVNEAVHDTDNPGSEPAVATAEVLVGTPEAGLRDARRDAKKVIKADGTSSGDKELLRKARRRIKAALDDALWVSDDTLVAGDGTRVFNKTRKAVNALQKVDADVAVIIRQLVMTDIALADVAIGDAVAGGAPSDDVAAAEVKLTKAHKAYAKGKAKKAIRRAKKAWKKATRYLL